MKTVQVFFYGKLEPVADADVERDGADELLDANLVELGDEVDALGLKPGVYRPAERGTFVVAKGAVAWLAALRTLPGLTVASFEALDQLSDGSGHLAGADVTTLSDEFNDLMKEVAPIRAELDEGTEQERGDEILAHWKPLTDILWYEQFRAWRRAANVAADGGVILTRLRDEA